MPSQNNETGEIEVGKKKLGVRHGEKTEKKGALSKFHQEETGPTCQEAPERYA